ncbi:FabD/lysophospholipase-like protein [Ascobolus immersus RN42]|uniref:FabD/lysophospholipase-like protein n=1 Tax=Ascobolus immersus RN42 TaxID=1160509 RepID=A0A3N4HW02_ASCIM|nr:FabD/lysophospholipase-like protein [Ascobolus immersus RN42]
MASQPPPHYQQNHQQQHQHPPPIPPKTPKLPERINDADLALANELKASWGIAAQDPKTTVSSLGSGMTNSSGEGGQAERVAAIGKLKEAGINIEDGWYGPGDLDKAGYGYSQKKRKIRVLSLDGGGIRGYSTLVILGELMHLLYVALHNKAPPTPKHLPRPADYFDIIGGNGTGGLIALMLGRMRMGVEDAKQWYVQLTRFVFITDKTVLGVPYGKTMFKKERLEMAIKECVGESTKYDTEPIDEPDLNNSSDIPGKRRRRIGTQEQFRRGSLRNGGRAMSVDSETTRPIEITGNRGQGSGWVHRGNPEAKLMDPRINATKTFVTTTYKGSKKNAPSVLLRTYPSRVESDPCPEATIWEAGRATCATASAFKPITIGQNTFLDEGWGQYNPAVSVLSEAVDNEYPDCEIGVFVSVGTGRRNTKGVVKEEKQQWWEGMVSSASPFENWAEARRRLIRKLAECEKVHKRMIGEEGKSLLEEKGVALENYYRLNVDVGVGEYAMNEWNRLTEVSTGTRRYLADRKVSSMVKECARKLAEIEKVNQGWTEPKNYDPPSNMVELNADFENVHIDSSQTSSGSTQYPPPAQHAAMPHPTSHPFSTATIQQQYAPPPQQFQLPPSPPSSETAFSHPRPANPPPPDTRVHDWAASQAQLPQIEPLRPLRKQTQPLPTQQANPGPPVPPVPQPYIDNRPRKGSQSQQPAMMAPEIRITSPTTVAGDSDDEDRMVGVVGRRRKLGEKRGRGAPYPVR